MYDKDGTLLGDLRELVWEAMAIEKVSQHIGYAASNHPDRDGLDTFEFAINVSSLGYQVRNAATDALHLLYGLHAVGDFSISRFEVDLAVAQLGGRIYGSGQGSFLGQPVVYVGTVADADQTMISWRPIGKVRPDFPAPWPEIRFPGLRTLELPDLPAVQGDDKSGRD